MLTKPEKLQALTRPQETNALRWIFHGHFIADWPEKFNYLKIQVLQPFIKLCYFVYKNGQGTGSSFFAEFYHVMSFWVQKCFRLLSLESQANAVITG